MRVAQGQDVCRTGCAPLPPAACGYPCLFDTCAEKSLPSIAAEVADFVAMVPPSHPVHVAFYFSGYNSCGKPSQKYDYEAVKTALSLPSVHGVSIYTLQQIQDNFTTVCDSPALLANASKDTQQECTVR